MGHKIYFTTFFLHRWVGPRVVGQAGFEMVFAALRPLLPLSSQCRKKADIEKEVPFLRRNSRCWLKMLASEMQPQNRMDARRPSKACMSLHSYDNCYSCDPHTLTLALVTTEEGQERQS